MCTNVVAVHTQHTRTCSRHPRVCVCVCVCSWVVMMMMGRVRRVWVTVVKGECFFHIKSQGFGLVRGFGGGGGRHRRLYPSSWWWWWWHMLKQRYFRLGLRYTKDRSPSSTHALTLYTVIMPYTWTSLYGTSPLGNGKVATIGD